MTSRFVVGFPEQRLSYLAEKIADEAADYCVGLQARTHRYVGLLRIADVAGSASAEHRILVDLLADDAHVDVPPDASPATIERLLRKKPGAVAVTDDTGGFVGLITNESFSRWLLGEERKKVRALEKQLNLKSLDPARRECDSEVDDIVPFPSETGFNEEQSEPESRRG